MSYTRQPIDGSGPVTIRWVIDFAQLGITLIVIALCFAAIGAVVRRILGGRTQTLDDGFLAFWLGFAVVMWFLILWNFAFRIDSTALLVVAVASGVCLAASGWSLGHAGRSHLSHPRSATIVTLLVATAWVTSQCLAPFRSWDGVLYHIQGVAWAKAYPVIPGIANLHGPLAFNNSSFLYDALLDSWLWKSRAFHLANGTLLLISVLQGVSGGLRWRRHGHDGQAARLFEFLLLPIALYYLPEVATYSTDLPMALLLSAAVGRTYFLLHEPSRTTESGRTEKVVVLALLFAGAIAIKLTAAVFAAAALAVLMWHDRRAAGSAFRPLRAWSWAAVALLILSGSLGGPWNRHERLSVLPSALPGSRCRLASSARARPGRTRQYHFHGTRVQLALHRQELGISDPRPERRGDTSSFTADCLCLFPVVAFAESHGHRQLGRCCLAAGFASAGWDCGVATERTVSSLCAGPLLDPRRGECVGVAVERSSGDEDQVQLRMDRRNGDRHFTAPCIVGVQLRARWSTRRNGRHQTERDWVARQRPHRSSD